VGILTSPTLDELQQCLQKLGVRGLLLRGRDICTSPFGAGALRKMLHVCSDFATKRNLTFEQICYCRRYYWVFFAI